MNDHRTPPKPPHFDNPTPGTCRWCNDQIPPTSKGRESKATWHQHCVKEYKLLFWPTATRRAVWARDKGICRCCGAACTKKGVTKWQMDHIKPLIESNGDISYWRMGNLQTLCTKCHTEKTSREATERAAKRKLLKEKKDE